MPNRPAKIQQDKRSKRKGPKFMARKGQMREMANGNTGILPQLQAWNALERAKAVTNGSA